MPRPASTLLLAAAAAAVLASPGAAAPAEDTVSEIYQKVLAPVREADTNGDGTITADESAELVERFDEDGDGKVPVADAATRLCLEFIAGGRPRGPKPPGEKTKPAMDDAALRDAKWKEQLEHDPRFHAGARVRQLQFFDANKDGKVQREEWPGADAARVFRKYDASKDGALDAAELAPLAKAQVEDLAKARRRPSRFEFVNLFDLDYDNQVTREEYDFLRGPASAFASNDLNKDGVVTIEESQYRRTSKYGGGNSARPDGKDITGKGAGAPNETKTAWDLLDKDGDKRVTLEEFGGNEPAFRRLDRNRDGLLTVHDG
jgi:Ca2+-binding EF-hand superfamily protein